MIFVAEIAYRDAGGLAATAWFSASRSWTTLATDTPASMFINGRLSDAGSIKRSLFAGGRIGGAVDSAFGVVALDNADGSLDDWRQFGVAGHTYTLWCVPYAGAPSSEWTPGPVLRMLWCRVTLGQVLIAVTDRLQELDVPLASTFFAGSGGLEGDAFVANVRKPWGAGDCYNVEPVLISSTSPIYVVHDGAIDSATIGRYERAGGAVQTREANYTSEAALFSTAPSAGAAKRYPAGGALRLGTSSSYPITSDISFGGTTSKLAHRVLESMALRAGISSGDISSADLSALDSSPTINAGYYCRDEESALSAMGKIASGGGLYFFFDLAGSLRVGKVETASGSPVYAFEERLAADIERQEVPGMVVPIWRVVSRWRRRWKTMGDVGGAASLLDRHDLSLQWDEHIEDDPSVLTTHPYAEQRVLDTYSLNLDSVAAPSTEGARWLALFAEPRALYRVVVEGLTTALLDVDLGSVVSLQMTDNRMGLGTSGLFRVSAVEFEFGADRATYYLFG